MIKYQSLSKTTKSIVLFFFLAGSTSSLLLLAENPDNTIKKISSIKIPTKNGKVKNPIRVVGTLAAYSEKAYFWLSVQFGNLHWPKLEIQDTEFEWTKYINESGKAGKKFNIVLSRINPEGQRIIEKWFKEGDLNGHYPGFEIIPDSETLDLVPVILDAN